jgi:cytochrome c5
MERPTVSETFPLQCKCGATAFVDIRITGAGTMSLTCFQCHKAVQMSIPAMIAEQAWERMEQEAPVPKAARKHIALPGGGETVSYDEIASHRAEQKPTMSEPEKSVSSGYKYGGLL